MIKINVKMQIFGNGAREYFPFFPTYNPSKLRSTQRELANTLSIFLLTMLRQNKFSLLLQ
jgi:hypothetical protein